MAVFAEGKIEAFCGPAELGAPDDLESAIVTFIKGAKKSLDIAVQELDNEVIAQAILDAIYRGISVRMLMEQDYLKSKKSPRQKQKGDQSEQEALLDAQWNERRRPKDSKTNRDILAALLRCSVDVKANLNPNIFHQKFIVRDYRNGKSQGNQATQDEGVQYAN